MTDEEKVVPASSQAQTKSLANVSKATALSKKLPVTSREIVAAWAKTPAVIGDEDLKFLWARSGEALASNWDAGAAKLAEMLSEHARPGQTIDQAFIKCLSPLTTDQLEARLRW
jgi:hypothetical protein